MGNQFFKKIHSALEWLSSDCNLTLECHVRKGQILKNFVFLYNDSGCLIITDYPNHPFEDINIFITEKPTFDIAEYIQKPLNLKVECPDIYGKYYKLDDKQLEEEIELLINDSKKPFLVQLIKGIFSKKRKTSGNLLGKTEKMENDIKILAESITEQIKETGKFFGIEADVKNLSSV